MKRNGKSCTKTKRTQTEKIRKNGKAEKVVDVLT